MLFVGKPQDKSWCEQCTLLARTERWYSKRNCSLFARVHPRAHQERMRPATLEVRTLRLFYHMRSVESCGRSGLLSWQFRSRVL